jgi:hypothetical protein
LNDSFAGIAAIPIAAISMSCGVRRERSSKLARRFVGLTDDLGGCSGMVRFVGSFKPALRSSGLSQLIYLKMDAFYVAQRSCTSFMLATQRRLWSFVVYQPVAQR